MSLKEKTSRLLKISTLIDRVTEKTGYSDQIVFVLIQDFLEKKINEADDERVPIKNEAVKRESSDKKEEIKEKRIELERLEKKYKSLIGELGGLKSSINILKEKIRNQDVTNYETREKKNKLVEEKNQKEKIFTLLQTDITKLRVDLQDLEEIIEQLEQRKKDLQKQLSNSKKEIAVLEYDNAGTRRKLYELNNEGEYKLITTLMWAATIIGILLAIYFVINKL